ncbi:MAG: DUF481 domain-containing protein [Verrucomicrobiota bacterium]
MSNTQRTYRIGPYRSICLIIAFFSSITPLLCDEIRSNDGHIFKGKIISESEDSVEFHSDLIGRISLPRTEIKAITYDSPETSPEPGEFDSVLRTIGAPIQEPEDATFDWIMLESGEWLKGDLNSMYSSVLEFDSDKMGIQEFDWEDVSRIRTHNSLSVKLDKQDTRSARLIMKDEQIYLDEEKEIKVDKYDAIAIAPDSDAFLDSLSARLSLSSNFRYGNTDQGDIVFTGWIKRRTAENQFYADFLSNYSYLENEVTTENFRSTSYMDIFWSKRIFLRAVSFEFYRDPLQNIDQRYTLGTSLGYYIIDTRKTRWNVTLGPAFEYTVYSSVTAGDSNSERQLATVFSSELEHELTKKLDWTSTFRAQYSNAAGSGSVYFLNSLEYDITDAIDLDVSLIWDRVNNPVENNEGLESQEDDLRLTIGIGLGL